MPGLLLVLLDKFSSVDRFITCTVITDLLLWASLEPIYWSLSALAEVCAIACIEHTQIRQGRLFLHVFVTNGGNYI